MNDKNEFRKIDSNGLAHQVKAGKIYQTTVRYVGDGNWTTMHEAHIAYKALIFKWENIGEFPELQKAAMLDAKIFIFEVTVIQQQENSYNDVLLCRIIEIL